MSKEFEEIVLKKLNVLDERINNTDKMIQGVVLKKLDATDKMIQETVLKQLSDLDEKINDTNTIVREIKQDFARFDYEINVKIDTLFDANTVNKEKHDFFENKIDSLDAESFNHDIRISNLEDKVLIA